MEGLDVTVLYNVPHEQPLSILIAIYFYMTGLSAGSFILSTLAYGFGMERFKPLGKIGVVMATLLLVLAPLNLIADLSQPFRFWHLFLYLNPTSPITWGSFLLTLYPLNCLIYAWFMFSGHPRWTRFFGLIGIPLAISVHGYTGFILALGKARALWNTALMPLLFLVSAMVSGIALMILVILIRERLIPGDKEATHALLLDLGRILSASILVDLFLVFSDVSVLLTSDAEAFEGAMLLLKGSFSPYFLGIEIFLGSLVPLFLLTFPATRRNRLALAMASALVMAGIMAMRYVMVIGGQSIPLA